MAPPADASDVFHINGEYDEQAAIEAAIAMSLQQPAQSPDAPPPPEAKLPAVPISAPQPSTLSNSFGPLGLDRKKMEADRLARQRKRTATEADLESTIRVRPAPASASSKTASLSHVSVSTLSINQSTGGLPFVKGVVKRTWAAGQPLTDQDIKIEDIFKKDDLELAVLSSFQWDETWLLSKIDTSRTRLILVAFANSEAQQHEMRANVPSDRIRFCFPPMSGGGYLHSKLQLLKFKGHLRIAIPSGNLVPYDWGETGVLENMVFLIDLPLLETTDAASGKKVAPPATSFGSGLRRFLKAQGLDDSLILSLDKYDFTETERYGFVHSISGSHTEGALRETGYCGLGGVVRSLGLDSRQPVNIHYLTSSLGSLDGQFLTAMYYACQGDSGMREYQDRQSRPKKPTSRGKKSTVSDEGTSDSAVSAAPLDDHFRIFFPSVQTVTNSKGGTSAAGTICFQERWWKSSTFPRKLLRDAVNTRRGLLMHSKMLFVAAARRDTTGPAWTYVGSANLSESAWGRVVKDRRTGLAKLTCRNWECGVLIPVTPSGDVGAKTGKDGDLEVFKSTLPVPMLLPGQSFLTTDQTTDEQRQPWFFRA